MIHFGDKFTFVHIPKTGGLWIADILQRHFDATAEYHPHLMPFESQKAPIIAVHRNPKDWWESWVAWGRYSPNKDIYYPFVLKTCDERHINEIVDTFRASLPLMEARVPYEFIAKMGKDRVGPLTSRIRHLNGHDVLWVDFDNLRQGWVDALDRLGLMTDTLEDEILHSEPYNETPVHKKQELTVDISGLEPCNGA